MNKDKQLAVILAKFTLEFGKRYLEGTSEKERVVFLANNGTLDKLLEVYQNFARREDLELWPEYSLRLRRVRGIAFRPYSTFSMYKPFFSSPERTANAAICLIKQINFRLGAEKTKSALDYKGVLLLNEI